MNAKLDQGDMLGRRLHIRHACSTDMTSAPILRDLLSSYGVPNAKSNVSTSGVINDERRLSYKLKIYMMKLTPKEIFHRVFDLRMTRDGTHAA